MKKKIALYTRVSTTEQSEHGYSIHEQEDVLIKHVTEHYPEASYELYIDSGLSGKDIEHRPAMKQLLQDAKENQIELVISWKLNRISRSMRDIFNIIHEFKNHGVNYKSISENIDTSNASGEVLMTMFGLIGSIERQTLISNVKMSMNAKARSGEAITGRVLGYQLSFNPVTQKNDLVIDDKEAMIVRQIFDLYLNHNKGFKAITTTLNRKGYHTINHKPFSVFGVKYILNNPVYKGYVRFNNHQNWAVKRRDGKSEAEDVILVRGKHDAIISENVFDQVHEKLKNRSFKPGRPIGGDFYLRGLIKCPECGSNMVCRRTYYSTKGSSQKTIKRYYICSLFNRSGSSACRSHAINAETVERVIHVHLNRILSQPTVIKQISSSVIASFEERNQKSNTDMIDLKTLEKQRRKIQQQLERLLELYLDDQIDTTILKTKQDQLQNQLTQLEQQIDEAHQLETKQKQLPNMNRLKNYLTLVLSRFSVYLKKADPEHKNRLMHMLIDSIEITKDKKVKLVKYRIDVSLLPQSIQKDWGSFYMPIIHFEIDGQIYDKNVTVPTYIT